MQLLAAVHTPVSSRTAAAPAEVYTEAEQAAGYIEPGAAGKRTEADMVEASAAVEALGAAPLPAFRNSDRLQLQAELVARIQCRKASRRFVS